MLGLQCNDANDLYNVFNAIKEGYLAKTGIIQERNVEHILEATDGIRADLSITLETIKAKY